MASIYSKNNRWAGVRRDYTEAQVERLRGTFKVEYSLAKRGSEKLWDIITRGGDSYVNALGALTGKISRFSLFTCKNLYLENFSKA
jgi:isocitrate lyase